MNLDKKLPLRHYHYYRACVSKALYRYGYSVIAVIVLKNFFVFEDIGMKLGTLMCYGFLINIVRDNFFPKINIF